MNQENFVVVIPAYNEEKTIRDIVKRTLKQCDKVIVVDDGSSDGTIAELENLPIDLIKHEKNQGKASSLWDGFQFALKSKIDFIITLDGDAQHAPEDIRLLISDRIKYSNHIIIGARLADKGSMPAKRYYANKIANFWIAWASGHPISDSQSGFRLYPVNLFDNFKISTSKNSSFVFESEVIIKAAKVDVYSHAVTIPAIYRENARPSHFQGVRDITLITLMVGRSLISRGMYPQGLYKGVIKPIILNLFK
jgi:glycosyltransferase involved in cell wall biosynthesis